MLLNTLKELGFYDANDNWRGPECGLFYHRDAERRARLGKADGA